MKLQRRKEKETMIKNLPSYAIEYLYIIATLVDEDLWFWGAFNSIEKAEEVAKKINGIVITNS